MSSQGTALSNLRAIVQQSDSKLCLEELCFKNAAGIMLNAAMELWIFFCGFGSVNNGKQGLAILLFPVCGKELKS